MNGAEIPIPDPKPKPPPGGVVTTEVVTKSTVTIYGKDAYKKQLIEEEEANLREATDLSVQH